MCRVALVLSDRLSLALTTPCRSWDSERLLENYWEGEPTIPVLLLPLTFCLDPDKVKKAAGVMVRTKSADQKGRHVDCPICFDTLTPKNSCSAECGHAFCNDCWGSMCFSWSQPLVSHLARTEHLELKINEGESVGIVCMSHKCRCLVSGNMNLMLGL